MKPECISFKRKRLTVRGIHSALSLGCSRLLPRVLRREAPMTLFQRCLAVHISTASTQRGLV